MKKLYAIVTALVLYSTVAKAQQTIRGWITDEQRSPIEYANVIVLSVCDSSLVTGAVTDKAGAFQLSVSADAQVFLRVSGVGYERRNVSLPLAADTLQLKAEAKAMEGVTVTAQRPKMAIRNDALVTTIVGSSLAKAGSGNDVLKRIPLLTGKEGSYSVVGRGAAVIYINNRKITDATEIERLNSSDIKDVEVITNPGARYDATVSAVIRIHTVRKVGDGFGFDVRTSAYYWENWDTYNQLNMYYRRNGLELTAGSAYNLSNNLTRLATTNEVQTTNLWTNKWISDFSSRNTYNNYMLTAAYEFNTNHAIGARFFSNLLVGANYEHGKFSTDVIKNNVLYDHIESQIQNRSTAIPNKSLSAYYVGKVGKLNIDFNTDYYYGEETELRTTTEQSANYDNRTVTSAGTHANKFFATKLVLSHPLFGGSLSVGNENTFTNHEQSYTNQEGIVANAASTIKERNNAFFFEYSRLTPIGQLMAGLRYEHVNSDYYDQGVYSTEHSRTYNQCFPSLTFATQIKKVGLQLSYSVKTSRPSYNQLGTDVLYINRFTRQSGNPTLKPETLHNITLVSSWNWLTFVANYTQTHNKIMYWNEQESTDENITNLRYRNFKRFPALTLSLTAAPTIGIWSPQLTLFCQKQWFDIERLGSKFDLNKPIWGIKWNNSFEFRHDWTAEAFLQVNSKGITENTELIRSTSAFNFSVRKVFLNDRLSVTVGVNDLFNRSANQSLLYTNNLSIEIKQEFDSRDFYVTLRYKFNTARSKYKGTGAGQSERNRF
ncbi:outer membrane beta-barrel family protein [Prevotella intermedia]|uniref:TonB-dependent receptor n=1 Tax=Prevotella intermedia TaxID=28131 RepID=A0A2G9IE93_PREIN|nr:outer membrane beta-barrel family protein [Prevotella intermedia]PIN28087.1 TonB-dependent receptor [Prevotella intermedia]